MEALRSRLAAWLLPRLVPDYLDNVAQREKLAQLSRRLVLTDQDNAILRESIFMLRAQLHVKDGDGERRAGGLQDGGDQ